MRVHGYEEKGSTTTPYDMLRLNNMDRWELAGDALRLVDAQRGTEKFAAQIGEWEAFREEAFQFAWMRATITPPSPSGSGPRCSRRAASMR